MNKLFRFLKTVGGRIYNVFRGKWSKPQLKELLTLRRQRLIIIRDMVQQIGDKERGLLATKIASKEGPGILSYQTLLMEMPFELNKLERKAFAESFNLTANNMIHMIDSVLRNLDNAVETTELTIGNVKVSHMVIMNLTESTRLFVDYVNNTLITVGYDLNQGLQEPAGWRYGRLESHRNWMIKILSIYGDSKRPPNPMRIINDLRKIGKDAHLITDELSPNEVEVVHLLTNDPNLKQLSGLMIIPEFVELLFTPFRWAGDLVASWRHTSFVQLERERDWMQAHVALLKLDLTDVDPDSAEHHRMYKIINNYEAMITETSQQLDKYYGI